MKAALFDVGDTLVEHWSPRDVLHERVREAFRREFGERDWFERFLEADIEPSDAKDSLLQETNAWYARWFAREGIDLDIEVDRLRAAFSVPLDLVSTPVPGAFDALRWCKQRGLAVVLVTNTLSRGDAEVVRDWTRMGFADVIDGVVSSHSIGWRKPHPAIFERALAIADAPAAEAFMVGDSLEADVAGAASLGIRTIWRRTGRAAGPVAPAPDATIADLTELPRVVEPWLDRAPIER